MAVHGPWRYAHGRAHLGHVQAGDVEEAHGRPLFLRKLSHGSPQLGVAFGREFSWYELRGVLIQAEEKVRLPALPSLLIVDRFTATLRTQAA